MQDHDTKTFEVFQSIVDACHAEMAVMIDRSADVPLVQVELTADASAPVDAEAELTEAEQAENDAAQRVQRLRDGVA